MPVFPRLRGLARGVLVAGVAGCSSSGTDAVTAPGGGSVTPVAGPAHIRIVQVVSDAVDGVDVSANGARALGALPFAAFFPAVQGQYQNVAAAAQLAFTATGASTPFYNQVPSALAADAYTTAVAFGRATAAGPTGATVVVLSDTNANAPSGVLVRVFNTVDYLSVGVGSPVDVYVYPQGAARPSAPDVAALGWGARSAYLPRAVGTLRVDVFPAQAAATGTPLFSDSVRTAAGSVRTLVLADPAPGKAAGSIVALSDIK